LLTAHVPVVGHLKILAVPTADKTKKTVTQKYNSSWDNEHQNCNILKSWME
jgi:hypothetical protein